MMTECWDQEIGMFAVLGSAERTQWLASLAAALTVAARDIYEVGGDDICDSKRMRRFNELLHRVVNQLRHQLQGELLGFPDNVLLPMVRDETTALGVDFSALKSLM
ncbi:hypothetical protein FACS1894158_14630 [Betaproteobacteria bacterium]|nr:hypothetical protein FACS1894158_14630 [Betaproteobacteria bacterium]